MLVVLALAATVQLGNGAGYNVRQWGGYLSSPMCFAGICSTEGWILHITPEGKPDDAGFWVIERQTISPRPHEKGKPDPNEWTWADSRRCPQLIGTLKTLSALRPVSPTLPGEDPFPSAPNISDDGVYRVSMQGKYRQSGRAGYVWMTGGYDSPVYYWIKSAEQALADCWSNKPPEGVLQNGNR